jgi:predicted transcriptional regulator
VESNPKFRSIGAFKKYEQKAAEVPGAMRILSVVKRRGGEARLGDVAQELGAAPADLLPYLDELIETGLVEVVRGADVAADLIKL